MSNFLAIATVTATLRQVLQEAVQKIMSGIEVTTVRPDSTGNGASNADGKGGINIFLYQITPNAALRNADLPTRRADGTLVQRPQAAYDLHYLLTFFGDELQLVPQRLLGSAVSTLHAEPVLSSESISGAINARTDDILQDSDLAEQIETVKFSPISLNLEELSKLWSVFFQTPYALSVAYRGSVVLLESDGSPQRALPVRGRTARGETFRQPVIEKVVAQGGPQEPIIAGTTLFILGRNFSNPETKVVIGGIEVGPEGVGISDTKISLKLSSPPFPEGSLRAGVHGVQVRHPKGVESNIAAFVLRPTIES